MKTSWPALARDSATAIRVLELPWDVTKSTVRSTLFFAAQSIISFFCTSLEAGTQWSQRATVSFPAAWDRRMNGGAVSAVVASAAVPMNCRRVVFKRFIGIPLFLEDICGRSPCVMANFPPCLEGTIWQQSRCQAEIAGDSRGWRAERVGPSGAVSRLCGMAAPRRALEPALGGRARPHHRPPEAAR